MVCCGFEKVIIIGAPRSGTNMLRDVLTMLPGCATWPCDEINYIWRHGNVHYPTDEFPPNLARTEVITYIKRQFDKMARKSGCRFLVEKTCANSLRVDFVQAIFPEAKFIFIYRDGIDVVASAMKRWTAPLDIPYLLAKARFVPVSDLPYYFLRYLWNRIYRLISREKRLSFWGPVIKDMPIMLQEYSLLEVCAFQWKRCVELAGDAFERMPKEKWTAVRYEDFVHNSERELTKICDFLGLNPNKQELSRAISIVSANSVGKGRASFDKHEIGRLKVLIGDTLSRYGYQ